MPKLLRFESIPHAPTHRSGTRQLSPMVAAIVDNLIAIDVNDPSGQLLAPVRKLTDQFARGFRRPGASIRSTPLKVSPQPDLTTARARSAAATTAAQESRRDIDTTINELQALITELRKHQR